MRWHDLETDQPDLAAKAERFLIATGVVLVGTTRRDGTARISAVEPLLWDGDLWLCMGWRSLKAADLYRDRRILVHSIVTSRDGTDGEFKLRGTVSDVTEDDIQRGFAEQVTARLGWHPVPGKFHLFRVDLDDLTFLRWDDATNDMFVARWPAGAEFVRRGTSATSQGPPQPYHELLR
jgi:hypothetical protein